MKAPSESRQRNLGLLYASILAVTLSSTTFIAYWVASNVLETLTDFGAKETWHLQVLRWVGTPATLMIGFGLVAFLILKVKGAPISRITRINHIFTILNLVVIGAIGVLGYQILSGLISLLGGDMVSGP